MTREEAKPYIGELQMYAKSRGWDEEYLIACDIAMNTLEQEPILDKVRAEIAEHIEFNRKMNYMGIVSGLALAKDVIDKYKAESEREK